MAYNSSPSPVVHHSPAASSGQDDSDVPNIPGVPPVPVIPEVPLVSELPRPSAHVNITESHAPILPSPRSASPPLRDVHPNLVSHAHSAPRRTYRIRPPTPYNAHFGDMYYHPQAPVSSIPAIPKPTGGQNFCSWVTNIELVLRRHQVWDFVLKKPPPPNERSFTWDEKDLLARCEILWSCDPDIQNLLTHCATAWDCWDALRLEFTVKDYIEIRQMVDDFHNVSKSPSESCKQFIDRVKGITRELDTAGRPISDEDVAYHLLFGLPDDYRHLRTSLISHRSDKGLLTSTVIPAILSEERLIINLLRHSSNPPTDIPHNQHSYDSPSRIRSSAYASSSNRTQSSSPGLSSTLDSGPQRNRRFQNAYRRHPYRSDRNDNDSGDRPPSCNFCLGYNHVEVDCFLKFPEKHPNHPVNRRPRTPQDRSFVDKKPPSSSAADIPAPLSPSPERGESSSHVHLTPITAPEEKKLQFEYNYFSGPPGIGNGPLDWMLDSGTTSHFVKWRDQFRSFDIPPRPIKIDTAAGPASLMGYAVGIVPLTVESGDIILQNVIYTPHLHTNCNLLSMAALDANGFSVTFSNQKAFITRRSDNVLWATGSLRSHLYFLDVYPRPTAFLLSPALEDTQVLEIWHKRLGHINARSINRLQKISNGIKIGTPPSLTRNAECVDCLKSSQHRLPSHLPTRGASRKLQIIHSDSCGPMAPAIGGKEVYFTIFVDDFTSMIWIYELSSKSDAFGAFQHFVIHVERECASEKVLILHTDNAGEYISNKMKEWCAERGIVLQTTQPYTPDMNGVAERSIRTIVENASALLWSSFLGVWFWYEVVKTAVYLKNRSPHSSKSKTPYELWSGIVPSLAHLRIFGCRCYALIPDKKRTKWESHGGECLFMGYYTAHNLFRLYDITSGTFIKRRDVIFHECVLGHHGFANNRLPIGTDILGLPVISPSDSLDAVNLDSVVENDVPIDDVPILANYLGSHCTHDSMDGSYLVHNVVDSPLPTETYSVPKSISEALLSPHCENWKLAMHKEIDSLERNNTWVITQLPPGKTALGCKWVYALRPDSEGRPSRFKARLVGRGDLQLDSEFNETFAPVAKFCSLKILLSIAAFHDFEVD